MSMPENLDVVEQKAIADDWKKRYYRLLEDLAQMLPPCVVDESAIKGQIQALLEVEEKLRVQERVYQKERETHEQEIRTLKGEIEKLKGELEMIGKRAAQAEITLNQLLIKSKNTKKNMSFLASVLHYFHERTV